MYPTTTPPAKINIVPPMATAMIAAIPPLAVIDEIDKPVADMAKPVTAMSEEQNFR